MDYNDVVQPPAIIMPAPPKVLTVGDHPLSIQEELKRVWSGMTPADNFNDPTVRIRYRSKEGAELESYLRKSMREWVGVKRDRRDRSEWVVAGVTWINPYVFAGGGVARASSFSCDFDGTGTIKANDVTENATNTLVSFNFSMKMNQVTSSASLAQFNDATNGDNLDRIQFEDPADKMHFQRNSGGSQDAKVFWDTALGTTNWVNFHMVYDSSQATASDRFDMYVDKTASKNITNNIDQNTVSNVTTKEANIAGSHSAGQESGLCHVFRCAVGQTVDVDDWVDDDNIPIEVSGQSWGDNGFEFLFDDTTSEATFREDNTGNRTFNVGAGTFPTSLQSTDVPTA